MAHPMSAAPPLPPSSLVTPTGGFAGTRRSAFPPVRPPGYFSADADPAAVQAFYRANGYIVLENGWTPAEIEALKRETTLICRGDRGALPDHPVADAAEPDDSVLARFLCIHFPHKCSPVMLAAIHSPPTVQALTTVIGPNVKCMQSMLFIKSSGKPGQAWHQDEDYIPTRDRSLTGAWIAIDRATTANGCLWVLPACGSSSGTATAASTAPSSRSASPTPTTRPSRSRSRPAPWSSSTATSCTARCPTTRPPAPTAARSSTTT
ncbi:MAG: phytanoyl-CoA dioxygenase family protein [Opitutales bacterium]|nr:phytanoyl-CoA dioxygenase family protein [Opitutales bacterium]